VTPAPRRSAGLLLFREPSAGAVEVLLGHMGGPMWARRDRAWTVPKGEIDPDEDDLAAAEREFAEELGFAPPPGENVDLGEIRQKAGKVVVAWARRADPDLSRFVSNTFEIEWPPRSGRRQAFPELDRVAWFPVDEARGLVVAAQVDLLDRLAADRSS
jgi:predicted NUDIX family NTP pyrophosphohydrolase